MKVGKMHLEKIQQEEMRCTAREPSAQYKAVADPDKLLLATTKKTRKPKIRSQKKKAHG